MIDEIKTVVVYNDEEKFDREVNGYCCNCDYKVMSCQVVFEGSNICFVAFLGKVY